MARSRLPRIDSRLGAPSSALAWHAVSQFPSRMPSFLAPFTRRIPAASSGLSSPLSAASYASRRTAASRKFIVDDAKWRLSSCRRYRSTTVLLKASLGSEQYHATKSSIAKRYARCESEELKVFRTAVLEWSRSERRRTRLGFRRKSGFFIGRRPPHRRTIIRNQFSFSENPVWTQPPGGGRFA